MPSRSGTPDAIRVAHGVSSLRLASPWRAVLSATWWDVVGRPRRNTVGTARSRTGRGAWRRERAVRRRATWWAARRRHRRADRRAGRRGSLRCYRTCNGHRPRRCARHDHHARKEPSGPRHLISSSRLPDDVIVFLDTTTSHRTVANGGWASNEAVRLVRSRGAGHIGREDKPALRSERWVVASDYVGVDGSPLDAASQVGRRR